MRCNYDGVSLHFCTAEAKLLLVALFVTSPPNFPESCQACSCESNIAVFNVRILPRTRTQYKPCSLCSVYNSGGGHMQA